MVKRNIRTPSTHTDLVFLREENPDEQTTVEAGNAHMHKPEYSSWKVFCKSFEYTFCGIMISYLAAYFLSQLLT